jgi:UDP-N-acetylmuramoyl-tripeptide--D-alanyl-D-alanine ligase
MSEALWRVDELQEVFGAASAPLASGAVGVSIDTRTLKPGELFVAIKGDVHDGHDHVEKAFAAGAVAALASFARAAELQQFGPVFAVDDTLRGMERLGAAARARTKAKIVAVTGSVGKTSAKEMLRLMCWASGSTHASAASFNNHWGVPLSLARLPRDTDYAIFEIGMNHAGEITPLVALVRPHVAFITTIAPVHIEYFGSLEKIADAKAEIFSGVLSGGFAVLNHDAPQFARLAAQARARALEVRTFGASEESYARLVEVRPSQTGSHLEIKLGGREFAFELGAPGRHMAENALGALTVVEALGASVDAAARALKDFQPQKGRGERFELSGPDGAFVVIDESYNANPASMRAALKLLGASQPGKGGRRIAVIGDMLELGDQGAALHAALAPDLDGARVDLLYTAGPLSRALFDATAPARRAFWAERSDGLRDPLIAVLRAGDVVMVKGSNGSRMGPLIAALREHFPRQQARG